MVHELSKKRTARKTGRFFLAIGEPKWPEAPTTNAVALTGSWPKRDDARHETNRRVADSVQLGVPSQQRFADNPSLVGNKEGRAVQYLDDGFACQEALCESGVAGRKSKVSHRMMEGMIMKNDGWNGWNRGF